jgi:hypothetical protein
MTTYIPSIVHRPLLVAVFLSGLLLLFSTIYFVIAQPVIPLFYTLARPSQQLVPKAWLFLFPGLSLILNALHIQVMHWLKNHDEVLLILFAWVGVAFQVMLCLALLRIILITF